MSASINSFIIRVPLLNTNDLEAQVADIHVVCGQLVHKGDSICVLETTKSTSDVLAESDGFVQDLRIERGQTVRMGDVICTISSEKGQIPDTPGPADDFSQVGKTELRITKPARKLALEIGIDLENLPRDRIVTEALVRNLGEGKSIKPVPNLPGENSNRQLLLFGGGGHAKAIIDMIVRTKAYDVAGIVDDGDVKSEKVLGVAMLGKREVLPDLAVNGIKMAVVAIGSVEKPSARVHYFELLASLGFSFPVLTHSMAVVEPSATLGAGTQVFACAYVGSAVAIGVGCIINTGAILSHDVTVGDYSHIAPGAMIAGGAQIGAMVLVGMGVTTTVGITIGDGARIGNSARLLADVPAGAIVQAGKSWPE